jgi:hypothetical protein
MHLKIYSSTGVSNRVLIHFKRIKVIHSTFLPPDRLRRGSSESKGSELN